MTHNMENKSFSIESLKGDDSDIYGRYSGSNGEEGGYLVISEDITSLRDGFSGLEGNLYGERNVLSKQSSESEVVGKISPKVKGLRRDLKKINGPTKRLKDQKGGSQVLFGGRSGFKGQLKGEEGDDNGKYDGLAGQEGGYLDILEDLASSVGIFPELEGNLYGKHTVFSSKDSGSGIIGGVAPITKRSRSRVKEINRQVKILKGEEGESHVVFGGRSVFKGQLKGEEGDANGKYDGLAGQEGGSLGILGAQPNLKDSLPGLEGDSYEQYNTISSKNSRPEITGRIGPKINMSYDTVKGISGETYILKGQEGDVDGYHDVLIDRTKGWNGEEGGSLNMKDDFSHFTIESENISTITEENVNPPRKVPTLLFENLLEHSSADSNPDSNPILTSVSNSFSNFGNKIPYIVVPFILILILLGISYKYFGPVWRKKLKKKQDTKKVINLCDKHKNEKEVTNTLTENN
ncbi:CIR protein [Plasmodium chabaudi chabaudi]|uniref:CIR protein n=1 Tax=Plasmodium chabaudi chabaudi TaxID=31271 RepID=A0A1D3L9C6_PLACU|nr:CIR protein [Plasmodium chabaudi chabaudi]